MLWQSRYLYDHLECSLVGELAGHSDEVTERAAAKGSIARLTRDLKCGAALLVYGSCSAARIFEEIKEV